ncbi:hypothetical protein MDA_GLEAN10017588 [Myotis davidii]|uniref:Uncharacterized protein n=1 Tax=Myotis davidii TaxID=225400 RepID=L5M2F6_MYODS|nr:hypothetical protein MDA_GLEAN10017588 [Myotis davidii]
MDLCHSPVTALDPSFSRQLHPPHQGPAGPQPRACPHLTKGNQICCSCSGREQALPETGKQLERDACQPGGVNIYTTWCVGRGQAEGGGRNQAALRPQVEGACALVSGGKGKRWLGSSSPPEFLHHSGQSLLPAGSWQSCGKNLEKKASPVPLPVFLSRITPEPDTPHPQGPGAGAWGLLGLWSSGVLKNWPGWRGSVLSIDLWARES